MSQERPLPPVTAELLSWLEVVFPDRLPDFGPSYSHEKTLVEIGAQKVIRKLRDVYKKTHEQALSGQP